MKNDTGEASNILELLIDMFVPRALLNNKGNGDVDAEAVALTTFREKIKIHQASSGTQQGTQRAQGFDYVRWKAHGTHRMHHNPDEYVQTCQGLVPYISSVAASSFEGLEERRWAGLTQAPPAIVGLPPKSGYSSVGGGSRSYMGSREGINQ